MNAFLFRLNNNENQDIFSPKNHPGVNIKCTIWVKKERLKSSCFSEGF